MKIGLVLYGSLDLVSGGFLYDRMLVEYLRRQGDQVEVVALPWRRYARHLGDNLSTSLFRRLVGLQVDLLLEDELNHPSLFWMNRRIKPRVRYPILTIVHHLRTSERRPGWQNQLYGVVERNYIQGVDGFIFNSRTTQQVVGLAAGRSGVWLGRPAVVAYPAGDRLAPQIREAEIEARAKQPGPLRIIFLGNLISRKGLHTLIAALNILSAKDWQLTVVGSPVADPRYARAIRRQVEQSGLEERVSFTGTVDGDKLVAIMKDCQLLAVPSSYEGFGIVYVEGMGFGLPAIASLGGAAREIITHGQDGFLVPPEDPACLAECLRMVLDDRQVLAAMGLSARRRYLSHPTWEQTGQRIREFLLQILHYPG
jgi:glycosyltransferase involved in cell wall biosynthesis